MNKKTIFYSLTAILWVGVSYFVILTFNKNTISNESLSTSVHKLEELHQKYSNLENLWWKRRKVRYINEIGIEDDIEILQKTQKALVISQQLKRKKAITWQDVKPFVPTFKEDTAFIDLYILSKNESMYNSSSLYADMYRNIIYQKIRDYWFERRRYIYEPCFAFAKLELHKFEDKEGIHRIGFIERKYSEVPIITSILTVRQGRNEKDFDFRVSIEHLGRNPRTITKRYRTTPKEGQELQPFDYEEIE